MTRVLRTASCGTVGDPNVRPSRVTLFASGRSPATEKADAVESVASMPTTPGASVASSARSLGSIGSRPTCALDLDAGRAMMASNTAAKAPRENVCIKGCRFDGSLWCPDGLHQVYHR